MGDTSPLLTFITKIDFGNLLMTIKNIHYAIDVAGTHGDRLADESASDSVRLTPQRDLSQYIHLPHRIAGSIFHPRQCLGIQTDCGSITRSRHLHPQGLVRTLMIVNRTELVEHFLDLRKVAEATRPQDLGPERTMKTLFLAWVRGMRRPAMNQRDPQPHQPCAQFRPLALLAAAPPRRAVVRQQGTRHAVTLEGRNQRRLDRGIPLVAAGLEREIKAAVVVQHRQRMTASGVG